MPTIRPSADLLNNYNEISTQCHQQMEPIFITKNGKGDLAVLSIEAYEQLSSKNKLYSLIAEGLKAEASGETKSFTSVLSLLQEKLE